MTTLLPELLVTDPAAQAMFEVLTSANRFALIHRVESMKRAESRARKITELVAMLARGETPPPTEGASPRTGTPPPGLTATACSPPDSCP